MGRGEGCVELAFSMVAGAVGAIVVAGVLLVVPLGFSVSCSLRDLKAAKRSVRSELELISLDVSINFFVLLLLGKLLSRLLSLIKKSTDSLTGNDV